MDLNRLLQIATNAGKILLESGAETYRVEETISRICIAYGVNTAESFVTPTGLVVSVFYDSQTLSVVKRIHQRGVNLNKIDRINSLSRDLQIKPLPLSELNEHIIAIDKESRYSMPIVIIFSAIAAGSFSYILGGNFYDVLSAAFIGLLIKFLSLIFAKLNINDFFMNFICSSISAIISILFYYLSIPLNIDKTIIGSIMLLVPGLAITNAIRDTIAGDFLAGLTRASEAFLTAIAIASGTGVVIGFFVNTLGGSLW